MIKIKSLAQLGLLALALGLGGCASPLLLAGGAAGGAAVAHDERTVGSQIDDTSIEFKAGSELGQDPQLKGHSHINVTSYNGIVLLTGEVDTPALRARATAISAKIERVRRVQNELVVAPPSSLGQRTDDTWITTKVKSRLLSADNVDGTRIKVITERKVVYLMGIVSRKMGDLAANAAATISGVQRVVKVFEYTD